jgi:hypothetical protein
MKSLSRPSRRSSALVLIVALALAAAALSCQTPLRSLKESTMPPDLTYIPPERVRSAMWVLAAEIRELDRLLQRASESNSPQTQAGIQQNLIRMREAARSLDEPGRSTQHPVLNDHLGQFLAQIRRAETAAKRNPPNYFPASTLSGSCFLCHGISQARVPDDRGARS